MGTLSVRYVVNATGADETSLFIDAIFLEADRRRADKSDGTVESAEYDAVRAQVEAIQQARLNPAVGPTHPGDRPVTSTPVATPPSQSNTTPPATASVFPPATATSVPQPSSTLSLEAFKDLQQRVAELRSQVEGQIKRNGTALRQAPISRSTSIDTLPGASTVVILVLRGLLCLSIFVGVLWAEVGSKTTQRTFSAPKAQSNAPFASWREVRVRALPIIIAIAIPAFSQGFTPATAANAKQFLGTWQASFQGRPFATFEIAAERNKLNGTMSAGNIDLTNDDGIIKAEATAGEDRVSDARVNGDTLRVTTKSTNGSEDSNQFDLKLVGPSEAELRFIGVPANVPAPKPWKLHRVTAQP